MALQDILLINLIIEHMICDTDPELGGAVQLMGLLRTLVDPENMLATANVSLRVTYLRITWKSPFRISCIHSVQRALIETLFGTNCQYVIHNKNE